jgi:hypothetical protein
MSDSWPKFICTYKHEGAEYCIEFPARDFDDAARRLRSIGCTGTVNGQIRAKILAPSRSFRGRFILALARLLGRTHP